MAHSALAHTMTHNRCQRTSLGKANNKKMGWGEGEGGEGLGIRECVAYSFYGYTFVKKMRGVFFFFRQDKICIKSPERMGHPFCCVCVFFLNILGLGDFLRPKEWGSTTEGRGVDLSLRWCLAGNCFFLRRAPLEISLVQLLIHKPLRRSVCGYQKYNQPEF